MKATKHLWLRLARAARQAPREEFRNPPFGFESRVIADWHTGRAFAEPLDWRLSLRGAFVCAGLLVLLSLAANYRAMTGSDPDDLTLANTVIARSLLP